MKVILLKDVKDLGRAHESVAVADGHALNFLIPKRLAVAATPSALKTAQLRAKQTKERQQVDKQLLKQSLETLAAARIVIRAKANEKGHLYNAIGKSAICAAALAQARVELSEDVVRLEKPFKELGTFDVSVAAGEDMGKFSVTIEAEASS